MLKRELPDLAICGGAPAFDEPLHVGRPNLPDAQGLQASIQAVLERQWLTNNGPAVQELEQRLAARLGVKHCVATGNGTLALQLLIRAAGLRGEVIVPSFTFIATAHALQWEGITPVFCDIDPLTHNLDPRAVEQAITPRTSGILGVHVWGRPCAVDALTELAGRHNLTLLFDAAHAFDCSHRQRMIGGFGTAEVFSFHATKFFHTLEGGAVTTNDDGLAETLRRMRNHGFTGLDEVAGLGINAKMNEVCAAVGLNLLGAVDHLVAVNRRYHQQYLGALAPLPGVRMVTYDPAERSNYQYVVLEIDPASGLSRDDLVAVLWAERVRARRYFYPGCHRTPPYSTSVPPPAPLPHTEQLAARVVCLPTGTALTAADIETICRVIEVALRNGPAVHHALTVAR